MKKTWQIWAAFAFCLAIGLMGMSWLSARVIELDRAEVRARQQAMRARQRTELQERIAMALWRMDWMLTPLIAQEATRPSFVYRPFLVSPSAKPGKTQQAGVPSPLLTQPPAYVVLNFDVSRDGGWVSPQSPGEPLVPQAVAAGISPGLLAGNQRKLAQLSKSVSFEDLLQMLPDAFLPMVFENEVAGNGNSFDSGADNSVAVMNEYFSQPQNGRSRGNAERETPAGEIGWGENLPSPPVAGNEPANQMVQQSMNQQGAALPPQAAEPDGRGHSPSSAPAQTLAQQEWQRRNWGMQNVARLQRAQLSWNTLFASGATSEREGVSRPMWIGSKLILARRVVNGSEVRIQGCWLDWPQIKKRLQAEVADLFPEIELRPVIGDEKVAPGRLLATLPVQLVVPETAMNVLASAREKTILRGSARLSVIRISLVIAWFCLLLGAVAIAVMLRGVLALSERRAAFVSAVTHELRSPLTTFRMYAEMLAEGMVKDSQQRTRYLTTLREEADRLSHLVENVLQYARLERGRRIRRRIEIDMKTLLQQTTERLPQRARQAGMELVETLAPEDSKAVVRTDPAAVEQILFNLIDNSCKYAGSAEDRRIHLHWSLGNRTAQVRVTDHGPGIEPDQARKLFRPFSKTAQEAAQTAPGIGLGLALCQRLASEIGGNLRLDSNSDQGVAFLLELPLA